LDIDSVRFFTVELRNGHVMSTPKYEPAQEFVGSLIHEVSLKGPEFAWVQFAFRNLDYHSQLVSLKAELSYYKKYADTPETKTDGEGREYTVERKEKGTEWYRSIQEKVKKIDAVKSQPTISMAIRGIWVGDDVDALSSLGVFSNCSDEMDRLAVVPLRDPRMLAWLVKRRVLSDPAEYIWHYGTKARKASPELMLTTDELPYYIHIPTGPIIGSLGSLADAFGGAISRSTTKKTQWRIGGGNQGGTEEEDETWKEGDFRVAAVSKIPALKENLDEAGAARLRHLASNLVRTFELTYSKESEKTELLIGSENSEDLRRYEDLLSSLYGGISYRETNPIPAYLRLLAELVSQQPARDPPASRFRGFLAHLRPSLRAT
jgi:hypothetical protein